jgi:hypothetical protein
MAAAGILHAAAADFAGRGRRLPFRREAIRLARRRRGGMDPRGGCHDRRHGRPRAIARPALSRRGEGATADAAAIAWAASRHWPRRHGERLPDLTAASVADALRRAG